jgi:hypothetical protein
MRAITGREQMQQLDPLKLYTLRDLRSSPDRRHRA